MIFATNMILDLIFWHCKSFFDIFTVVRNLNYMAFSFSIAAWGFGRSFWLIFLPVITIMIKWVWQRVWSLRRDPGETGRRGQMGRMMQTPRGMTRWTVAHWIIFQVHSTWNSTSLQNIVKRNVRLFFINHIGYPSNYASFLSSIGHAWDTLVWKKHISTFRTPLSKRQL